MAAAGRPTRRLRGPVRARTPGRLSILPEAGPPPTPMAALPGCGSCDSPSGPRALRLRGPCRRQPGSCDGWAQAAASGCGFGRSLRRSLPAAGASVASDRQERLKVPRRPDGASQPSGTTLVVTGVKFQEAGIQFRGRRGRLFSLAAFHWARPASASWENGAAGEASTGHGGDHGHGGRRRRVQRPPTPSRRRYRKKEKENPSPPPRPHAGLVTAAGRRRGRRLQLLAAGSELRRKVLPVEVQLPTKRERERASARGVGLARAGQTTGSA